MRLGVNVSISKKINTSGFPQSRECQREVCGMTEIGCVNDREECAKKYFMDSASSAE